MSDMIAGVNSVLEALRGKRRLHKIYLQEGRRDGRIAEVEALAAKKGVFVQRVAPKTLDALTELRHQGVAAEVDAYPYVTVQEILLDTDNNKERPFILLLDGIEDPQNLGAIIRTAECAGAGGVVLPKRRSAEISGAVVRASAGAVEHIAVAQAANLAHCMEELKQAGYWLIGADPEADTYFQTPLPLPAALVIGGERRGLRRLVKTRCDLLLRIPMRGKTASLNASTAAALFMYEILRQSSLQDTENRI
jgi:23S rRNA (guanosine2251-2'-O)-methyltransferase